eukprot:1534338-Alexandrium_andersonii.AAC.1
MEVVPPAEARRIEKEQPDRIFKVPARFVLTEPSGTAKARLVIPGHLDPDMPAGHRSSLKQSPHDMVRTDAPVAPQQALHLACVLAAVCRWRLGSFDVRAAFLTGDLLMRTLF